MSQAGKIRNRCFVLKEDIVIDMFDIGFLIDRISNDRAYSTFSGPYELAGFLLLPVPLLLNEIIKEKKYSSIIFIILCFIGIFVSESRIGYNLKCIFKCTLKSTTLPHEEK